MKHKALHPHSGFHNLTAKSPTYLPLPETDQTACTGTTDLHVLSARPASSQRRRRSVRLSIPTAQLSHRALIVDQSTVNHKRQNNAHTFKWSSSSVPAEPCNDGAPPAGIGTTLGGGWKA